jgi:Protein of unknown function (DUF3800)
MVTQAFVDESIDDNGTLVLGGYIASADKWEKFSKDWEQLLRRFGRLGEDNHYRFKMSEMTQPGHIADVLPFYRAIEEYDLIAISFKITMGDLKRAQDRVSIEGMNIEWNYVNNPYTFAMRSLMDLFHANRDKLNMAFPAGETIDFIFDNRSEKKAIMEAWDRYLENKPDDVRKHFGAHPRFEDDLDFLPLQAADLWAWWVRKWYADGTPEKIAERDFGFWKPMIPAKQINMSMSEDDIAKDFVSWCRTTGRPVYDAKYFPRPGSI